jgi:hypothetical protein
MNRYSMMFVVAAAFAAAGAYAQDQAPAAAPAAPQTKEQKKAAWEAGVKTDCAAEIADGGVCAGKDFSTGLEKCLHENSKKLSPGCKVAVHPHHKHAGAKAPATNPAIPPGGTQPQQAPATTP